MRLKSLVLAAVLAGGFSLPASAETIKIGVTPGPHAQIMEKVKELAAPKGLDIEILEFSDYVVPNQALADGDLNANSFQHQPYLDNQVKDRGYDLVSIATSVNFPMGVYSQKVKAITELADGAQVAVPNDPTNGGRALLLLADLGLFKLDPAAGLKPTPLDITENPKNIKIAELDAATLARRCGRSCHQHQLRAGRRPRPAEGCDRQGSGEIALRQRHRRARCGQGCRLGEDAGRDLSQPRGKGVRHRDLQGRRDPELVSITAG
jgi:YaeC family lipoprotein